MADKYRVSFGSDPEAFLWDKATSSVIVACDRIGGTKKEPLKISDYGSVLEDNVAVEFNPTAATTAKDALENFWKLKDEFRKKYPAFDLTFKSSWLFPKGSLATITKAQEFGCEPDFNAYENPDTPREINREVLNPDMRYCGGHIHLGIDPWPDIPKHIFVQFLDVLWYCQQVISLDKQSYRRPIYGKAGLFRPKEYGVEYRTPSNFWADKTAKYYSTLDPYIRRFLYLFELDRAMFTRFYRDTDWKNVVAHIDAGRAPHIDDDFYSFWIKTKIPPDFMPNLLTLPVPSTAIKELDGLVPGVEVERAVPRGFVVNPFAGNFVVNPIGDRVRLLEEQLVALDRQWLAAHRAGNRAEVDIIDAQIRPLAEELRVLQEGDNQGAEVADG